jgi:hypothetical protein
MEMYYVRYSAKVIRRMVGSRMVLLEDGRLALADQAFAVCKRCGVVQYYHERLGMVTCCPIDVEI